MWWAAGLAALLPVAIRRLIGINPNLVIVAVSPDTLEIDSDRSGDVVSIGRVSRSDANAGDQLREFIGGAKLSRAPIAIRLAPDQVLQKDLALPNAAAENLRQVLEFEMEQQTPFRADQVYFDGVVLGSDATGDRINVRLTAVPRETVDRAIEATEKLNLSPALVGFGEPQSGMDRRINLAAHAATTRGMLGRDRILIALAILLAAAALVLPGLNNGASRAGVDAQIARLEPTARQALALRQRIEAALAGAGIVGRAKQAAPSAVRLLEELSVRLADDTWLVQMNMVGRNLNIEGTSPSAAALVGVLEGSPLIESVEFQTPITRNNITNREHFNFLLRASIPNSDANAKPAAAK